MYLHSINTMHSKRKYTFKKNPWNEPFSPWHIRSISHWHFQQLSHDTAWNQHRKLQCVHDFNIKKEFLSAGRAAWNGVRATKDWTLRSIHMESKHPFILQHSSRH